MEPTFTEGDIIVVIQQPDVETNEIAVVLVNGDEGTVKTHKKRRPRYLPHWRQCYGLFT